MAKSLAEEVAMLSEAEREAVLADLDLEDLEWDSKFWLRPEQIEPVEDYRVWLVLAGRGFGKGLRVDTLIPTPEGFTKISDLNSGDKVFDESGNICTIVQAHDPYMPEKLYKVKFSDGSEIIADAPHQWVTWTAADRKAYLRSPYEDASVVPENWPNWKLKRLHGKQLPREDVEKALTLHASGESLRSIEKKIGRSRQSLAPHIKAGRYIERTAKAYPDSPGPQIRTTEEILETLTVGSRGDLNHCIPSCPGITTEERDLPLDPYLFGVWLGDGYSALGAICGNLEDIIETEAYLLGAGFTISHRKQIKDSNCYKVTVSGLSTTLRMMGALNSKSVPEEYLWSSEKQRLDLLAGLLDTDGHIGDNNHIEFCNTNENIADAVYHLAASLGQKPVKTEGRSTLNGVDYGPKYRITWRPTRELFRLERKKKFTKNGGLGSQGFRSLHRMIVSIEEVEPTTVRCLTVDSPNSMYLCGTSFIPTHNTRAGSEWIREKARDTSQGRLRMGIVAKTAADVRDTVVEGLSGILAVHPPSEKPTYEPSKRLLTWPNGNECLLFSSESPDQLRGPSLHYVWGDEFAAWSTIPDSSGLTAFDNAMFATREGKNPQLMLTTTPKKVSSVKKLLADSEDPSKRIIITRGKTSDNSSNLDKSYIDDMYGKYAGTKLMEQELEGILLDDIDGVLWLQENLDDNRVFGLPTGSIPPLRIVGVDPSVSDSKGDEAGIVVCGSTTERELYRRHAWVLEDSTVQGPPEVWANAAVNAARRWRAPIVIEKNQGGALLRGAIHNIDPNIPVFEVWAKQGKFLRAEPISLVYQQNRVHHVGMFPELEAQMTTWTQEDRRSPDRIDALVHALTALLITPPRGFTGGVLTAKSMAKRSLPPSKPTGSRRGVTFGTGIKLR